MKILPIIFSVCCFSAFGQYTSQNSQGPTTLRVVDFIDENSGYIGGNSGKLLKTSNGGDDWTVLNGPTNEKVISLCMLTADLFYFTAGENSGSYFLYKSTDGGNTFQELTIPNSNDPHTVEFIDAQTGFVTAMTGGIYKTIDGGASWYSVSSGIIRNTHFVSPLIGYAHGVNFIQKTTDGGETWASMFNSGMFNLGTVQFHTFFFSSEGNGHIASEYYGQLVSSNDDFQTGVDHLFDWSIMDIYFTTDMVGYATEFANPGNYILKTTDGGVTWVEIHDSFQTLLDQYYVNENLGWIVGAGGTILKYEPNVSTNEELAIKSIQLSPNPATNQITVSANGVAIEGVSIYTNLGTEVLSVNSADQPISIEKLPSGIYHAVVKTSNGIVTEKLVKN